MRKRGRTPDALTSVYCRDRRDAQFDPPGCNHAFIGDGMIHGFYLEPNAAGGSAIHRNHWVRTLRWEAEHEAGRSVFGERGMPSDPSVAAIDRGRANTNIASHAGRLMALQEQSERFELNSKSFDGSGRFMTTGGKFAPHPKMDLELGGDGLVRLFGRGPAPLNNLVDYGAPGFHGNWVAAQAV
jgi:carotenoid cleavage dioxygenase-like enzyme